MRKIIFGLFLCLFSSTVLAAESDTSVVFKANFLKHELQSYEITRTLYTLQKSDTTSMEKVRFKADVFVADSSENYFVLNWRFSRFTINTADRQLEKFIALAKPIEISCRISKPGVFMEFLDGGNVSSCLEAALPVVLAPYVNKKDSASKAQVSRIFDMRETIETLMLRTVDQFHAVYGLGYNLNEVVDVPTEVVSRFSPNPIQGIIRKKLTKIDSENHLAILSTATFLDQKQYQKALKDYLHLESAPATALDQENMGGVVMDLGTGWLLWSFDQREAVFGKNRYGELIEIQHINTIP
jgi:hypothetical protein